MLTASLIAAGCSSDDDSSSESSSTAAGPPEPNQGGDPLAPQPLAERTEVTIGLSGKYVLLAPILMAQELGEYEKENLDVNIEVAASPDLPVLLDTGKIDAMLGAFTIGVFNFINSGGAARAVFPMEPEYDDPSEAGIWVRKDLIGDDGFQATDLDGVEIALPAGISAAGVASFYSEVLADGGVAADDVVAQALPLQDTVIGLTNGTVDAGLVFPPMTGEVRDSGCCEFVGGNPPMPYAWIWFGERLIAEDTEVGLAFLRAIGRTWNEWFQGDFLSEPEKVAALAEVLEQPEDSISGGPTTNFDISTTDPAGALEQLWDFWLARDDMVTFNEPLELDEVFDLKFLERLYPDLKL